MCEILFLYYKECWKKGRKRRIPFCPFLFLCAHRCIWLASSSSLVVIGTREQHLRGFPFPLRFPLRCSRHAASLLHLPPNSSALFFPPFFLIFFLIFSFVCLTTKIPAACSVSSCPFSPSSSSSSSSSLFFFRSALSLFLFSCRICEDRPWNNNSTLCFCLLAFFDGDLSSCKP